MASTGNCPCGRVAYTVEEEPPTSAIQPSDGARL